MPRLLANVGHGLDEVHSELQVHKARPRPGWVDKEKGEKKATTDQQAWPMISPA